MKPPRLISLPHCLTSVAVLAALEIVAVQLPNFALSIRGDPRFAPVIPKIVGFGQWTLLPLLLTLFIATYLYLANRRSLGRLRRLEQNPRLAIRVTPEQIGEIVGRPGLAAELHLPPRTRFLMSPPSGVADHGGPLRTSPFVYSNWKGGRREKVIYLPAVYLNRLREHPEATLALIAHEIAHLEHHDADRERIATATFIAATLVAVSCYIYTVVTLAGAAGDGLTWQSVVQAMVRRTYLFFQLLVLVPLWCIPRRWPQWREALADAFAARAVNEEALEKARILSSGGRGRGAAGLGKQRRDNAHNLTWMELAGFAFLTGFTVHAILTLYVHVSGYNAAAISSSMVILGLVGTAILNLCGVAGSMLGMLTQTNPAPGDPLRSRGWKSLCLGLTAVVVGQTLAACLIQGAPLIVPTLTAMPGRPPAVPVDWLAALLSILRSFGLSSILCTLFAVLALALAPPRSRWQAFMPALVCFVGGPLEIQFFPESEGRVTVIVIAVTILILLALHWFHLSRSQSRLLPRLGQAAGLAGLWAALIFAWACSDDGHLSLAAHRAAVDHDAVSQRKIEAMKAAMAKTPVDQAALSETPGEAAARRHSQDEAIRLLGRAAQMSPWTPVAQINLERCLTEYLKLNGSLGAASPPGWLDTAMACTDRALGNPTLYRVSERFALLCDCGALHLEAGTDRDNEIALARLEEARGIRLRYPKIAIPEDAWSMLYNHACARQRIHGPDRTVFLLLLEAAGAASAELERTAAAKMLALHALEDPDLARMDLQSRPLGTPPIRHDFPRRSEIERMLDSFENEAVPDDEVMRSVRRIINVLAGVGV